MTGRERRARSASTCPACSGAILKGQPVRVVSWSWPADLHVWCARKDAALDTESTGVVGEVTG